MAGKFQKGDRVELVGPFIHWAGAGAQDKSWDDRLRGPVESEKNRWHPQGVIKHALVDTPLVVWDPETVFDASAKGGLYTSINSLRLVEDGPTQEEVDAAIRSIQSHTDV